MATRTKGEPPFDMGANFLVQNYQATLAYCRELGIGESCRPMFVGKSCNFKQNNLYEVTAQPLKLLLKNRHLSLFTRLKLARWFCKEVHRHLKLDFYDLSNSTALDIDNAYDYTKKNAGPEIADYVVDAFTSAYQFHGAKEISLAMMLALLELMVVQNDGFKMCHTSGGMATLPMALARQLNVQLNAQIEEIVAERDHISVKEAPGLSRFDAVVMATTANVTELLYKNPTARQAEILAGVHYASTINMSFLVPKIALKNLGLVMVAHVESSIISEYTDESMKGTELVCDGLTLVNVGLHSAYAKKIMNQPDITIFEIVKKELRRVCPLLANDRIQIDDYDLQRWPEAMPKYYPGFLKVVKGFLENGQGGNHVFFCGDYLNSPWIEGSVRCGRRVAKGVLATLE